MTNQSLIPVLAHRLPEFVKDNYPNFVDYIRDYLTFLEEDDNFLGIANAWRENMEPSIAAEPYVDAMLTDLGFAAGQNLAVDKKLLLHLLKDFYLSRGSEASFRFLFRMLFNADVEIRYPREQMLVPSYAEYGERHFIFTSASNIDLVDFQSLVLFARSNGGTLTGLTSKVNASIENIQIFHGSGVPYFQIEILRPNFEFIVGEAVNITAGDYLITEFVKPVLSISITDGGAGYKPGDAISVNGAVLNGHAFIESTKKGGVTGVDILSPGTGYAVGDLIGARSDDDGFGFSAEVSSVSGTGITGVKVVNSGYNYETVPLLSATTLKGTSNVIGAINSIKMENPFVDFDEATITITSSEGTGAVLQGNQVSRWETRDWADRKGFLEENSTLIDSDRVQQFSYTIVSSISSKQYNEFVADYLHPVGYVRSSSYEIVSNLGLNIVAGDVVVGGEEPIIYPTTLNLTFTSNPSIVISEAVGTELGEEIVTNSNESIIVE